MAGVVLLLSIFTGAARAEPSGQRSDTDTVWGAIAFMADGSYNAVWKMPSKAEAEAAALKDCARRGRCEVISFRGQLCAALVSFSGTYGGRQLNSAYTGGGLTVHEAQKAAFDSCKEDRRTRGRCQLQVVVCGDGR